MKNYIAIISSVCLAGGLTAFAAPVSPTFTDFGSLDANWGGSSSNPHDAVAVTTFTDANNNTVTLGLAAQQRFFNPPLANNGAGTYYATSGQNNGGPGSTSAHQGALWNFDFYFDSTGGGYTYQLFYGTDSSSLLSFDPTGVSDNGATPNSGGQNSQNLLFGDFGGVANNLAFNPNLPGTYSFELVAYDRAGGEVASSAINVVVNSAPDGGSTAGLLGFGILGLMLVNYRRNRLARAK
jgi:hypothetical protein